ncbi:MAG: hypothetical protein ACOC1F_13475 [Myxococcota bacterium]
MVARKDESIEPAPDAGPVKYESPWKMLVVFGVLLLVAVLYGFLT